MLIQLVQGLSFGFSNAIQPGPFLAYLLSQTLTRGPRPALRLALAPLVSDGPIILLVLLVLTRTPDWLIRTLSILGGLLLIYLAKGAYDVFRTPAAMATTATTPAAEAGQSGFLRAVLMNSMSPGPYIFWSAVGGPILIRGWAESPGQPLSFLLGFYVTLIGGLMGYILLFATASRIDPRLTRTLNLISAIALLLFGIYRIWQGLS